MLSPDRLLCFLRSRAVSCSATASGGRALPLYREIYIRCVSVVVRFAVNACSCEHCVENVYWGPLSHCSFDCSDFFSPRWEVLRPERELEYLPPQPFTLAVPCPNPIFTIKKHLPHSPAHPTTAFNDAYPISCSSIRC